MSSRSGVHYLKSVMEIKGRGRVGLLYRRCLKSLRDYFPRRIFVKEAQKIRDEIEMYKDVKDESKIEFLILRAEAYLNRNKHPIPKVLPYEMGGVAWGRELEDMLPIQGLEEMQKRQVTKPIHPMYWTKDHEIGGH